MILNSKPFIALAVLCVIFVSSSEAQSRRIKGTYKNYAKGFAVSIPDGLEGVADNQPELERGVVITTSSGSTFRVWGEPNSLEWKTPEDGIKWVLNDVEECSRSAASCTINPAQMGRIDGAEGRSQRGDRVVRYVLVFRPKGGPIYWLHLKTTADKEADDVLTLRRVASSFKIIAWR